jgi:hypothetical protein
MPGWLVQVGRPELAPDGRSVILTMRVRRWHPGLWLALLHRRVVR